MKIDIDKRLRVLMTKSNCFFGFAISKQGVTFEPYDFNFNALCTFKTADPKPAVCTSKCSGPTAECRSGTCKCGDPSATFADG
jgi:hypothetical protein